MIDDRYIVEEYDGGIRIIMKKYKEWVATSPKNRLARMISRTHIGKPRQS